MTSSIYDRLSYVAIDKLGVDPLRSKLDLSAIVTYVEYSVPVEEEYKPDLIAWDSYKSVDLWWVILKYNNMGSNMELRAGTRIKIPDVTELTSVLLAQTTAKPSYRQIQIK